MLYTYTSLLLKRSECSTLTTTSIFPNLSENSPAPIQNENQILEELSTESAPLNISNKPSITSTSGYLKNKSSTAPHELSSEKEENYEKENKEMIKTKIFKNREGIEVIKKNNKGEEENCKQFLLNKFGFCNEDEEDILNQQRFSRSSNEGNIERNKEGKKKRFSENIKMDIEVNKAIDVFDLMNSGKEGINSINKVGMEPFSP
ncbi:unnamed protein product [Meloidogyne enterolobii]|uniref:Uncharacterized protein n=1 Tax=Meloidogyne enterolobii TaxID=390850 RepID=A0ACB1AA98_MELEN